MKILVVIPAYNEAARLAASVRTLQGFLDRQGAWNYEIAIAENGSTDQSPIIADCLAKDSPQVRAVHLARKGRGAALRNLWSESDSDILTYMDVDLSTDLPA